MQTVLAVTLYTNSVERSFRYYWHFITESDMDSVQRAYFR